MSTNTLNLITRAKLAKMGNGNGLQPLNLIICLSWMRNLVSCSIAPSPAIFQQVMDTTLRG